MWKAIVWALIALPLGGVLGASMGGVQGAAVAAVVTAVAGAPPVLALRRACRSPCRGCPVVCKTPKRSPVSGVATVVVAATLAAVVARAVLGLAAPFLLPLEAVALGACVAARAGLLRLSPVLQRTGRLGLYSGPLAHKLAAQHQRPRRTALPAARQTALPVGTSLRAIEAPKPAVQGGIISSAEDVFARALPKELRRPARHVITDARERTGHER